METSQVLDQHEENESGDFFATVLFSWVWENPQRCNGHSTICCIVKGGFAQREDQPGMVPLILWQAGGIGFETR